MVHILYYYFPSEIVLWKRAERNPLRQCNVPHCEPMWSFCLERGCRVLISCLKHVFVAHTTLYHNYYHLSMQKHFCFQPAYCRNTLFLFRFLYVPCQALSILVTGLQGALFSIVSMMSLPEGLRAPRHSGGPLLRAFMSLGLDFC